MNQVNQHHLIRLRARPDTLFVSQGRTVLAADRDGFINGEADHGLFVHETRLVSRYRYLIDGQQPAPVALSNVEQHSWLGYYVLLPPGIQTPPADEGSGRVQLAAEQTLELRLSRYVGEGVHEDVDLLNYSLQTTAFTLELEVEADFADLLETRGERRQHGRLQQDWRQVQDGVWELRFDYRAEHAYDHQGNQGAASLHRCLTLRVENASSSPGFSDGRITFPVELEPQGRWHACLNLIPWIDGQDLTLQYGCRSFFSTSQPYDRKRQIFLGESTRFRTRESDTLAAVVTAALEQAKRDLSALRLYDLDHGERAWTPAAGLPVYVALFGRDSLTAAWQAALASPDLMRGTLPELARWQGKEVNDWRDEQPGRMLHEAHTGPLETLHFNPRGRYYGSITTSGFYPVVVSELWHWTGDRELVGAAVEPMLRSLEWLDRYGDLDGDGFYEYQTRSIQGTRHQAWKDSRDAIVDETGRSVEPPVATCEEQGFAYIARLHASEVLWWFDRKEEARQLFEQAGRLKEHFNQAFWMPDLGFFAMGLDSKKRQIQTISSNPGHLLATGIAADEFVPQTAERLFRPDLFNGWGIRTLSAENPAYNPFSYHRGSIWPVEHGTFALGFMRYGLHDAVEKICLSQFKAAALFEHYRLPEVFAGHALDEDHPFPALYAQANVPQAWSASALFNLIQALLGLYPYAPLNLLLVDPHLPAWLPEITLEGLRVGNGRATIQFYRTGEEASDYRVLEVEGNIHVIRQPSPWSLSASFGERLRDFLLSLLPGK